MASLFCRCRIAALTALLLLAAIAQSMAEQSSDTGRIKIFGSQPVLLVVNGYSTSFHWPDILRQKIDRYTGEKSSIEIKSATAGGSPISRWMDVVSGQPREVWQNKLTPLLESKGERQVVVLAQQSLQGCFGEFREGIRGADDTERIERGAEIIQNYIRLLQADGADFVFIAMHIYKHPMEPEIGNERLALRKFMERGVSGVLPGPDVWSPTRDLYPVAFAADSLHPGEIGNEVMAQLWFQTLLRNDGLQVPDWSLEKVREIRSRIRGDMKPDCDKTSVGIIPLTDLGGDNYKGYQGGLYLGGKNSVPGAHLEAGLKIARNIVPLDGQGEPDRENGRVVLLSIGMSNTTMEFQRFMELAAGEPRKNPKLTIVDGAFGGQSADRISLPDASYWTRVDQRLREAGVSNMQVRVAWIKQATPRPESPFPKEPRSLQNHLRKIVHILHDRYPNLALVYLSSRIYGGYASTLLNPEPHAFETAFAVKWLIEEQIEGGEELNYDPSRGGVRSPWLAWGPYLWADGLTPRSDGLTWECGDFGRDGTHPGNPARDKVARALLNFFKSDSTVREWFLAD